jgi:hypothetical protein
MAKSAQDAQARIAGELANVSPDHSGFVFSRELSNKAPNEQAHDERPSNNMAESLALASVELRSIDFADDWDLPYLDLDGFNLLGLE